MKLVQIATLVLLVVGGAAQADETVWSVDIFTGDSLKTMQSGMQANGWITGAGGVSEQVVADLMYKRAVEDNRLHLLPASNRCTLKKIQSGTDGCVGVPERSAYESVFHRMYGHLFTNGEIKFEKFAQLGRSGAWKHLQGKSRASVRVQQVGLQLSEIERKLGAAIAEGRTNSGRIDQLEQVAKTVRQAQAALASGEVPEALLATLKEQLEASMSEERKKMLRLENAFYSEEIGLAATRKKLKEVSEATNGLRAIAVPVGYGLVESMFGIEAADRYAENKGWYYLFLFLLLVGVALWLQRQLKQKLKKHDGELAKVNQKLGERDEKLQEHDLAIKGDGTGDNPGLINTVSELAEAHEQLAREVRDPKSGLPATNLVARQALLQGRETLRVLAKGVVFDNRNRPPEELLKLAVGEDHAVYFQGRDEKGKPFMVAVWNAGDGRLQINARRHATNPERVKVDPKNLLDSIAMAVVSGRIISDEPVKPVVKAAAV